MENRHDVKNWSETVRVDMIDLLLGRKLGEGMSREVFECALNHTLVVKVESNARRFQNICEWEIWQALCESAAGKWLAPCAQISSCGTVMLQARTEPLQMRQLPARMPRWLTDFKKTNYGLLKGRVVCHDYGTAGAVILGLGADKRTKAVGGWSRG